VPARVDDLVYGGVTLTADEAAACGLVNALASPDDLIGAATAAADMLASRPHRAFAMTKRQLHAPAMSRIKDGERIDRDVLELWCAPETLATIRTYVEKTFKRTATS